MIRSGSGIARPWLACQWMECDDVAKWAKQSRHELLGPSRGIDRVPQGSIHLLVKERRDHGQVQVQRT